MLIDSFNGGSTEAGHQGWFDLADFGFDIRHVQQLTANGAAGPVSFGALHAVFGTTNGLTQLLEKAVLGQRISGIRIEGVTDTTGGSQVDYRLHLVGVKATLLFDDRTFSGSTQAYEARLSYEQISLGVTDPTSGVTSTSALNVLANSAAVSLPTLQVGAGRAGFFRYDNRGFLALSGMGGTSLDGQHAGWFDEAACSFGMTTVSPGQPVHDGFSVTLTDVASVLALMAAFATGHALQGATLQMVQTGRVATQFDLSHLVLRDMKTSVLARQSSLTLDFSFDALEHSAFAHDLQGNLADTSIFGWNTATNVVTTVPSAAPGAVQPTDKAPQFMLIDGMNGGTQILDQGGWFAVAALSFDLNRANHDAFGAVSVTVTGQAALTQLLARIGSGAAIGGITFDGQDSGGVLQTQTSLGGVHVVCATQSSSGSGDSAVS